MLVEVKYINWRLTYNRKAIMKKLFLASASVLTLISACTKEVEDRAGILQKFTGLDAEAEVVQDIGIERLTTTLPEELSGQTIVANVMREGISEELPEEFIEGYVGAFAAAAEAMITGEFIEHGDGEGAFIIGDMEALITSDSDAEDILGAIYTQGLDEDMVGVAIVPGINEQGIMVIAAGTEVSNIPTGEFDYEGANFVALIPQGENIDGYYGSFKATVDFAAGKGSINADFENDPAIIDGDFTVDTATGIFVGKKLELDYNGQDDKLAGTSVTSVTIHGNFHGDGATGMTGIYTENVPEPDFIGAIAGQQVEQKIISDSRLKSNIRKVGVDHRTALNLYEFTYTGDNTRKFIGVMADEVELSYPDAVVDLNSGFKAVNYDMLGIEFIEITYGL